MQEILDLVRPYANEILAALTAALVTLIRAWVQQKVALKAAEKQKKENGNLPDAEKKAKMAEHITSSLPLGVRPFSRSALDKLVETAHKRVSDNPPEK